MADNTAIEWTHRPGTKGETWNPTVGCSILSPGCTHCYAMNEAARQIRCAAGLNRNTHYAGTVKTVKGRAIWTGKINLAPEHILLKPLRWRQPRTVFVNSMSDLFHESIPDAWIDKIFAVMALCQQHTFQVLTKRAERMREYMSARKVRANIAFRALEIFAAGHGAMSEWDGIALEQGRGSPPSWPLPNVWLGVSAERQQEADERIPHLLQTPAAIRFVSAEPLLGPINLRRLKMGQVQIDSLCGLAIDGSRPASAQHAPHALDWIIVGGESGPNARPTHPQWARDLRDQCKAAGVAFFFKQWGEWAPGEAFGLRSDGPIADRRSGDVRDWMHRYVVCDDRADRLRGHSFTEHATNLVYRVGKKRAGRLLDGKEHNEFPVAKAEHESA